MKNQRHKKKKTAINECLLQLHSDTSDGSDYHGSSKSAVCRDLMVVAVLENRTENKTISGGEINDNGVNRKPGGRIST